MDAKAKFNQFLTEKGLRRTLPRDIIADLFLRTEKHLSTQELFEIVRKKNKNIGYATVARTVKLLEDAGLCRQIDFGDRTARYEHEYNHEHHDHIICTNCGKFVEIHSDKLEKIQDSLVKKHGFVQQSHKLTIYGLCPKCKGKG
jgi:Fur family ferric uptake transcriptional regulator